MKNPFEPTIPSIKFDNWLSQFEIHEIPIIEKIVEDFRYYDPEKINEKLKKLYKKILRKTKVSEDSIFFVPVGYVAKSGSAIAYFFKTQNEIPQSQFILPSDLESVIPDEGKVFVFLDDYIGTGHQARQVWDGLVSINPKLSSRSKMIFAAIVAKNEGIKHLEENSDFVVISADKIYEEDMPFGEKSKIFPEINDREIARKIIEKYGAVLHPEAPLGYASSQGILGFFYSTPNNTLPIFWSTEGGWNPLLPHKESFRDPAALFGPPSGLPKSGSNDGQQLKEVFQLSDYDVETDIAIKILSEFKKVDIFLSIVPIIKSIGLEQVDFPKFIDLINVLRELHHEKEPVSSSVMFVPDGCPPDALGQTVVETDGDISLKSIEKIISMATLIDGTAGGMIFDRQGNLTKGVLFREAGVRSYTMLPGVYHRVARASLDARGLAFFFLGDGRSSVFYRGNRILVYRGASWHLQPSNIENGVTNLAKKAGVSADALKHVFRLAAELSDRGYGALLTVGDHENVLSISEIPETTHMVWPAMKVETSSTEAMIGLMRQDGATIIDAEGNIVQGMTFLRPPPGAGGKVEVGKGSKHSSASKVSGATKCISLAISVDGQITVFFRGEIVLKLMG